MTLKLVIKMAWLSAEKLWRPLFGPNLLVTRLHAMARGEVTIHSPTASSGYHAIAEFELVTLQKY